MTKLLFHSLLFYSLYFSTCVYASMPVTPLDGQVTIVSGGTFTQALDVSIANQIESTITISNCINTDTIYCRVSFFDNFASILLGTYDFWAVCASSTVTPLVSDAVPCITGRLITAAIMCTDATKGGALLAGSTHDVAKTCS